jgi:hypothetical protein
MCYIYKKSIYFRWYYIFIPVLNVDNTKVVTAKEAKPKGLGFATIQKNQYKEEKKREKRKGRREKNA